MNSVTSQNMLSKTESYASDLYRVHLNPCKFDFRPFYPLYFIHLNLKKAQMSFVKCAYQYLIHVFQDLQILFSLYFVLVEL